MTMFNKIPAALTADGGELQFGRKRAGLCPDFRLRLPTAAGPLDSLGGGRWR